MDIDEIDVISIKPKDFYDNYIKKRIPCKFMNHINDNDWHGNKWTNTYLKGLGNDIDVRIEKRDNNNEKYGKGNEKIMKFNEFLNCLENEDETLYLTTQDLEYDGEGRPELYSNPVKQLIGNFPLRPSIMGNLIPQNYNIWMGYSKTSSSSGLHHDFHDNLYILLRGEKRISLFPPKTANDMYTVGEIIKIYDNGRINYEGQSTNEDGSDPNVEKALMAAKALEQAGNDDDSEAMERAMEDALDAEMDDDFDEDDFDDDDDDDDIDDEEENEINAIDPLKLPAYLKSENSVGKRKQQNEPNKDSKKAKMIKEPSNFSKVDTSLDNNALKKSFPKFINALKTKIDVVVKAGEMLYIPAGWFHEVKSISLQNQSSLELPGHFAFNYWFHPPSVDNDVNFEHPYKSNFWINDYNDRINGK